MLATGMGKRVSIRWRRSLASPLGPKSWSLTQTLLAKLRIENWLTFLIWLQSKLTRSQATGLRLPTRDQARPGTRSSSTEPQGDGLFRGSETTSVGLRDAPPCRGRHRSRDPAPETEIGRFLFRGRRLAQRAIGSISPAVNGLIN
jgi:hypothetical protein